jgi:hypothetical protein
MRTGIFTLCSIVLLLGALSLPAQQGSADGKTAVPTNAPGTANLPDTTTIKARTDLVLVPVVVRGKHGEHIAGLARNAFHLEENGKEQTISLFEEPETATVDAPPKAVLDRGYSNLPFDDTHQLRLHGPRSVEHYTHTANRRQGAANQILVQGPGP